MVKEVEIKDIKAETLLLQLDVRKNLCVNAEGVFARNYSEDLMNFTHDLDRTIITVSRDGIFHLLPNGLFFKENMLKNESKRGNDFKSAYSKLKKKKEDIFSFFQPFDTELFKLSLEVEQKLNEVTLRGNSILLPVDQEPSHNESIEKARSLIPYASNIRGNLPLISDILKKVIEVEDVEIQEINTFHTRFIFHKEGLDKYAYHSMDEELQAFFDFFRHWFLPIEKKYDFRIKDYTKLNKLGDSLILDYNTHL